VSVLGPQPVAAAVIAVEHVRDRRVVDRLFALVNDEVLLADIRDVCGLGILGEQVIEGLVLGRPKLLGNGFVPFLAVREFRIDVEDDSAEIEDPMAHHLADRETRAGHADLPGHRGGTLERSHGFLSRRSPRLGKAEGRC